MGDKTETLECKAERVGWKQWIPVIGVGYACRDFFKDKSSYIAENSPVFGRGLLVQVPSISAVIVLANYALF